VDEYGLVRIEGTVTPLEPSRQTDIKVIFRNVDVPKFTAYSIPFAGREIASGSLDLDLGYKVEQSSLLGENKIVLRDFELGEEVPHPGAMSLPLGLAVALLKDREGNIDIDLPVRGNVDDPEFSYGGVIMKALGNLIVKIVTSPFALLGNLVGVEADQLEYVYFPAGRSDLTPPEMQKAEKIAEALTLRPQLALNVQGAANETEDFLALREAALDAQIDALLNESAEDDASFNERRRRALETLLVDADPVTDLAALQATYTATPEGAEGDAVLDEIAYTDAIYESLVKTTVLPEGALATLAAERAANLVSVIQAADPELESRTSIASGQQSVSMRDEGVPMKITLEASGE
jgi:hypothetical protein